MIQNHYTSRNIPNPATYEEVFHKRIAAKKAGDKNTANSLKLILNTTYGAMLNKYNELYDPLMARSVCISGQLYLLELAEHLLKDIPGLRVVEENTDGIMLEFEEEDYDKVKAITDEWQQRTGFGLEEETVDAYYAKDVSNYVAVIDGKVKLKGAYLVRGIAPAGAFNINNNAVIVADAITKYFVHGTPPEDTIRGCKDIAKFMLIAKAGSKYSGAYQMFGGNRVNTQKVNRVYASPDESLGTLYKVKADTGAVAKIEGLPEHCVIDNSAVTDPHHLKVDQIDLQWYINLAHSRIDDFLGATRKKGRTTMAEKTATTPKMNIYQKLNAARLKFLEANVQKSGKHPKLMYKFFELDDIVPVAEKAFAEVGLLARPSISENVALITIIDVDKPDDVITFEMPFTPIQPIVSNSGQTVTNEMQALGASITYVRRYLWMLALDICESDEIDNGRLPTPQDAPAPAKSREETVKTLTDPAAQADELQLRQLAELTDQLKASSQDPKALQLCKIAEDTTRGFTTASRENAALLLGKLNEYLNGGKA